MAHNGYVARTRCSRSERRMWMQTISPPMRGIVQATSMATRGATTANYANRCASASTPHQRQYCKHWREDRIAFLILILRNVYRVATHSLNNFLIWANSP